MYVGLHINLRRALRLVLLLVHGLFVLVGRSSEGQVLEAIVGLTIPDNSDTLRHADTVSLHLRQNVSELSVCSQN